MQTTFYRFLLVCCWLLLSPAGGVFLRRGIDYDEAYRRSLLEGCGEVCELVAPAAPGKYYDEVHKHIDCEGLFRNKNIDIPDHRDEPLREIPESLREDFSMGGRAAFEESFPEKGGRYLGGKAHHSAWTVKSLDMHIALARNQTLRNGYGTSTTRGMYKLFHRNIDEIKGKHMCVIGSENPWLEGMMLEAGARHVTTIEYGAIESSDPRVTTLTPDEVRTLWLDSNGKEPHFDGCATWSSVEHSGLGRYGDALNPWGDLQMMAKAWCMMEDSGAMFVGVPVNTSSDAVLYNANRQYSHVRWPQLLANYRQLDEFTGGGRTNRQQMVLARRLANAPQRS